MTEAVAPADGGQGAAASSSSASLLAGASTAPAATQAAPATAPAASPSAQLTAPPAAPANPTIGWLGDGVDETTLGYVANKGWDSPAKAISSYQNLEKLLGADRAGNTVILPKEGASPQEMAAFYDRIGRPADPSGYQVKVPEGGNAEFQKAVASKMHELGVPKAMGEGLVSWYNEQQVAAQQAALQAKAADFENQSAKWKQEQGAALTQNLATAGAAARALGLDGDTLAKLDDALGPYGTLSLLHKIGSRATEADFVGSDSTAGFGNVMSPAQAKAEIKALTADKGWVAKLTEKNADALAKWDQLHKWAYPE